MVEETRLEQKAREELLRERLARDLITYPMPVILSRIVSGYYEDSVGKVRKPYEDDPQV